MLQRRLKELEQLKGRPTKKARSLLQLCHARKLKGGLSLALDLTPDEAFAPIVQVMQLAALKLLDVLIAPAPATRLEVRLHDGSKEKWEVEGLEGLIHNLNDLCRLQPEANPCAVLGEWEDMLQVWAAPREVFLYGLNERWLDVRNPKALLPAMPEF